MSERVVLRKTHAVTVKEIFNAPDRAIYRTRLSAPFKTIFTLTIHFSTRRGARVIQRRFNERRENAFPRSLESSGVYAN